ncbi:MAG: methyltransferase domain-containing protein [Polyangiaceae bacterium]
MEASGAPSSDLVAECLELVPASLDLRYQIPDEAIPEEASAAGLRAWELSPDAETLEWLRELPRERKTGFKTFLQRLLREYISDFDANALLDMYPMFLLSQAQLGTLLGLTEGTRLASALDVGAGSGDVTRKLAPWCERLTTTERSWGMARRLRRLGFECLRLDLAETTEGLNDRYELVSCFNVLDRCPKPQSLLRTIRGLVAPEGRLLLSVPLPFEPMYYAGARTLDPLEALDVAGSEWSEAARRLCSDVLPQHGFRVKTLSRAPYLSGGDSKRAAYVLDTAVVVAEVE